MHSAGIGVGNAVNRQLAANPQHHTQTPNSKTQRIVRKTLGH